MTRRKACQIDADCLGTGFTGACNHGATCVGSINLPSIPGGECPAVGVRERLVDRAIPATGRYTCP